MTVVAPVTTCVPARRTIAAARMEIRTLETLLDLLDEAVAANGDKNALSLRLDDGSTTSWTYRDLDRRSRLRLTSRRPLSRSELSARRSRCCSRR